jgi:simple sugar transport system ATP-binding protein
LTKVNVRNEQGRMALDNVSLSVAKREIVGIAGVAGNGQTELAEILIGLRAPTCGTMYLFGHSVTVPTPTRLRTAGIALIPQDRQREGLALPLAIEENLLLSAAVLEKQTPGILLSPTKVRHFATTQISRFQIRTTSPTQPVSSLSGGNQQRVVIARELASNPQILVAVNPTRGLDIGATHYVHQAILECGARGAGIVLISTDLDEILALSTRIYTLYQGKLLGPVESTVGRTQLGRMMTGTWEP